MKEPVDTYRAISNSDSIVTMGGETTMENFVVVVYVGESTRAMMIRLLLRNKESPTIIFLIATYKEGR